MRAVILVGLSLTVCAGAATAGDRHVHRHHRQSHIHVAAQPSVDAIELSLLAPPTRLSTIEQTYGDAAFARSRMQRREARAAAAAPGTPRPVPFGIDPCEPRTAGSAGYSCRNDAARPGYGNFYAYMPAAASAPQVPRDDPSAQMPILAPVTAMFHAVNAARFDQHN